MDHFSQFKSFWNFLKRNKLFTAINVFGFAVSLTFVVLIGLYVQDELSVNASQPNKERIYRLRNEDMAYWPVPIKDFFARYPSVETVVRMVDRNWTIQAGDKEAKMGLVLLADSSFATVFDLPWVEGTADRAMLTRDDAIISEACARTWFGGEPALGKILKVNGRDRIVSGVFRDLKETHFKTPEVILPFTNVVENWGNDVLTQYGNCSFYVYLMTRGGA